MMGAGETRTGQEQGVRQKCCLVLFCSVLLCYIQFGSVPVLPMVVSNVGPSLGTGS